MSFVSPSSVWVTPHKMVLTKERSWHPVPLSELHSDATLVGNCENAVFCIERYKGVLAFRTTFRVCIRPNHTGSSMTKFGEGDSLDDLRGVWAWCVVQFDQLCRDVSKDQELKIDLTKIDVEGYSRKALLAVAKERVAAHVESIRAAEALLKKRSPVSSDSAVAASSSTAPRSGIRSRFKGAASDESSASPMAASIEMASFDSDDDEPVDADETASRESSGSLIRNAAVKRKLLKAASETLPAAAAAAATGDEQPLSPKVRRKKEKARAETPAAPQSLGERAKALKTFLVETFTEPFPSREQRTVKLAVTICSFLTLVMLLSRVVSFDFFVIIWMLLMYAGVEVAKRRREIMLKLYKRKVARTRREIGSRLKSWLKGGKRRKGAPPPDTAAAVAAVADADENDSELDEITEEEIVESLVADDDDDREENESKKR